MSLIFCYNKFCIEIECNYLTSATPANFAITNFVLKSAENENLLNTFLDFAITNFVLKSEQHLL